MNNFLKKHPRLTCLPDVISCFNLLCGFFAIVMVAHHSIKLGAWLILISLILDSLDGNIARIFKNPTQFGRELDSLADLVSFVVAPAFLALSFVSPDLNSWVLILAFFYVACGAFRLARFNVREPVKGHFEGLPSPAAAIVLSMTILACLRNHWEDHSVVAWLLLLLSWMMVSEIRYPKISALPFSKWRSLLYLEILILVVMVKVFNLETAFAAVMAAFLFFSPVYSLPSHPPKHESEVPLNAKDTK